MGCLLRVYRLIIVDFLSSVSCSMSCYTWPRYIESVQFNINDIHVSNICFNDACLYTLSTVISSWSKLCEIYFRICLLSRPEVVTEPALHRRSNDNFQWRHWHRSWHCDSSRFSTHYAMSLCNVLSRDLLSSGYRKDTPWFAHKGEVRGVFCGFIIWSVLCLSHFVLFSMSRYFQPIRAIFDRDIMRAYGNYISEMICHILVMWCCQQISV